MNELQQLKSKAYDLILESSQLFAAYQAKQKEIEELTSRIAAMENDNGRNDRRENP